MDIPWTRASARGNVLEEMNGKENSSQNRRGVDEEPSWLTEETNVLRRLECKIK